MAKTVKGQAGRGKAVPNPGDYEAFRNWLEQQPRDWSVVIASRAALRVLPLVAYDKNISTIILPVLRALAIARFAAKYPTYADPSVFRAAEVAADIRADSAIVRAVASAAAAVGMSKTAAAAAAVRAAAASAAVGAASAEEIVAAVKDDAEALFNEECTVEQLADSALWSRSSIRFGGMWNQLKTIMSDPHWRHWIAWYERAIAGVAIDEGMHAAFTDLPGELPWKEGAANLNAAIARRIAVHRSQFRIAAAEDEKSEIRTIARLAEVASPQPSITEKGQLDAGPNQPFDIPTVDDDLSTLPLRQRNIIKGILNDLPANAPRHLKSFLRSYDEELKARGAQPILGLLKDNADIIAAAVGARQAQDEWLEPGMRKAFNRFAENHNLFVEHFPLDAEREEIYAQTPVNESKATGKDLAEPFKAIAQATENAHTAGEVTDDFRAVVNSMNELGRIVATLPSDSHVPEIRVSSEDRIAAVTVKKRTILGALGFFKRASDLINERNLGLTASGLQISDALSKAVQALLKFLG